MSSFRTPRLPFGVVRVVDSLRVTRNKVTELCAVGIRIPAAVYPPVAIILSLPFFLLPLDLVLLMEMEWKEYGDQIGKAWVGHEARIDNFVDYAKTAWADFVGVPDPSLSDQVRAVLLGAFLMAFAFGCLLAFLRELAVPPVVAAAAPVDRPPPAVASTSLSVVVSPAKEQAQEPERQQPGWEQLAGRLWSRFPGPWHRLAPVGLLTAVLYATIFLISAIIFVGNLVGTALSALFTKFLLPWLAYLVSWWRVVGGLAVTYLFLCAGVYLALSRQAKAEERRKNLERIQYWEWKRLDDAKHDEKMRVLGERLREEDLSYSPPRPDPTPVIHFVPRQTYETDRQALAADHAARVQVMEDNYRQLRLIRGDWPVPVPCPEANAQGVFFNENTPRVDISFCSSPPASLMPPTEPMFSSPPCPGPLAGFGSGRPLAERISGFQPKLSPPNSSVLSLAAREATEHFKTQHLAPQINLPPQQQQQQPQQHQCQQQQEPSSSSSSSSSLPTNEELMKQFFAAPGDVALTATYLPSASSVPAQSQRVIAQPKQKNLSIDNVVAPGTKFSSSVLGKKGGQLLEKDSSAKK